MAVKQPDLVRHEKKEKPKEAELNIDLGIAISRLRSGDWIDSDCVVSWCVIIPFGVLRPSDKHIRWTRFTVVGAAAD